jgi:hypothetical protein
MALSKTVSFTPIGLSQLISVSNAYCKVTEVSGNKKEMKAVVGVFENKDAAVPMWQEKVVFLPSMDSNFIAQAYEHLKKQEEFADAVDC